MRPFLPVLRYHCQALATQLRQDLQAAEAAAARKLESERSVRRAAEEELSRTRTELERLQHLLGGGSSGSGAWGMPPPAMAAPGFKWVLVSEADDAPGGAGSSLGRRRSSMGGGVAAGGGGGGRTSFGGLLDDEDLPGLPGSPARLGSARSSEFDPAEMLAAAGQQQQQGLTQRAAAAGGLGAYTGAVGSPAGSTVSSSRAAGAGGRLGGAGGTIAEAAVQRLRAALRQKAGECAGLEGRLRELEATRDSLACELVKATHSAEQVRSVWCWSGLLPSWVCPLPMHTQLTPCLTCHPVHYCTQATDALARVPKLQAELHALASRYAAAVELLGERDEQLEELAADLADVKQLYKSQIEALVAQLAAAGDGGGGGGGAS
jgi:hypothetical protein